MKYLLLIFFLLQKFIIFGHSDALNRIKDNNAIESIFDSQIRSIETPDQFEIRLKLKLGKFLLVNEILDAHYGSNEVRVKEEENIALGKGKYRFTIKEDVVEIEMYIEYLENYILTWILGRENKE